MEPKSLKEAFQILDSNYEYFPYAAISYFHSYAHTQEIEEKINSKIAYAFDGKSNCLLYLIVAEKHLSVTYIDPLIKFIISDKIVNELWEEQAIFVLQQLTQQYPDIVMDKIIKVLDNEIDNFDEYFGIHSFLFDVFPFINKEKYTPWFIKTIQKHFMLDDYFLRSVMYLGIPETIPYIHKAIDNNNWDLDEVNIEELKETFTKLVKGKYPKKAPIPFVQSRKKWNEYYMDIESKSLTEEEMEALSRIPFPVYIMDKSARNEPCHCGRLDEKGKELKYKDCCYEDEAAIVNLPRFTKETRLN